MTATLPPSVFAYSDTLTVKVDRIKLHNSPFVLIYVFDKSSTPFGFAQIDCSPFLLEETTVANFGFTANYDIPFEFRISATGRFPQDTKSLEPLHLMIPKYFCSHDDFIVIAEMFRLKRFPLLAEESKQSLLQSVILLGSIRVGEVSRKVFTSLASRVDDISDTVIATKYSTVIFSGGNAGNLAAIEDILHSKFSFHIVELQLGLQVLNSTLTEKLTVLIAAKQFAEADKLLSKSLHSVLEDILPSSSSGTCSFRLSSLLNTDPLSIEPPRLTDPHDNPPHSSGAKLVATKVTPSPLER